MAGHIAQAPVAGVEHQGVDEGGGEERGEQHGATLRPAVRPVVRGIPEPAAIDRFAR
jgi:hypothetical protein